MKRWWRKPEAVTMPPLLRLEAAAAVVLVVVVLLSQIWTSSVVAGFNLEPRLAVVKEGVPGSYFGFAVEQHQIVNR